MEQKPEISNPNEFEIKYVKSNDFKSHFSTGIIGGVTLNRLIDINFFMDKSKIPEQTALEVKDGIIGKEKPLKPAQLGSTRELLVEIFVDINTAKVIIGWLKDKIILIEADIEKGKELIK